MTTRQHVLAKVRDFNLLMKYGHWVNGRFLDLKVLDLSSIVDYFPKKEDMILFKNQLKLAIAVGLKVSKSAVKRNRVKRQAREVVRLLMKEKKLKTGFYILIVARKDALEKEYLEISQEIELLLKRAGILC